MTGLTHLFPTATMTPSTIHRSRLLDRFLQYVSIGSTANPNTDAYPSSPGQLVLGKLLAEQMKRMGLDEVEQDSNGLVWGTIPASVPGSVPTILLNAHLDTSPEASGEDVQPQVIESYAGGDIALAKGGKVIRVADCPALNELVGKTLITTDGSTLLGGDDKAGVAIIMELAEYLMERPALPHGPIRILFTCDEEIGRGTAKVDLNKVNARVGYTLDGGGEGVIDQETFSADMATIYFHGTNIHPSIGKGRMHNSIRAMGYFLSMLPTEYLSPESTDGRQGFIHPYHSQGSVSESSLQFLLRDFETSQLTNYAESLRQVAKQVEWRMPGIRIEVKIDRQYRNMADGLRRMPSAVGLAQQAFEQLQRPCQLDIIRGGTDGALLTEMGLPTPNLSSGQHNIHSELEFACLDQMVAAVEHLVVLLELWQNQRN